MCVWLCLCLSVCVSVRACVGVCARACMSVCVMYRLCPAFKHHKYYTQFPNVTLNIVELV